jgi:glycosyltransferase involved in cell wall biosynthesis
MGFVFPSQWEGFGIPALEAMGSGCPVAISQVASLPEVCGDAALYFDPASVDSMAEALVRLVEDEAGRAELTRRGVERARLFSYARCAEKIVQVIRSVTGEHAQVRPRARPAPRETARAHPTASGTGE